MATRKQGHLNDVESLTMNALRNAHRRLRKARKVRMSFRRWLRREGSDLLPSRFDPKPRRILEAA